VPHAVATDGARIYYEVHGDGEPIVLIMGLGSNIYGWARTIPWLVDQGRWQVVALDNRGVGRSDVPEGGYTIEQMADDVAAVLDAAGVDSAHVVGASLGGMVAQRFAVRHRERVRSLVLLCTSPGGPNAERASEEVLSSLVSRADDPANAYRANAWFLYSERTRTEHPDRIEEDIGNRLKIPTTPQGYLGQFMAAVSHDVWDELPTISAPTLVVHGCHDLLIPPGNGRRIADRIPGATYVEVQAGHMMQADALDEVREAVGRFLDLQLAR